MRIVSYLRPANAAAALGQSLSVGLEGLVFFKHCLSGLFQ
jgi:hypothetical protein